MELLIAVSLFSFGMLSVIQIFPINRRYLTQSAQTTQAAFLAQEQMEIIRELPYSSITTGTFEARHTVGTGTSDPLNQFERQTVVSFVDSSNDWAASGSDTGLKKIDVTVYWLERTINRQYGLSTYVSEK